MATIAILGLGSRGKIYSLNFASLGAKITAICDKNPDVLEYFRKKLHVPKEMAFLDENEFFKAGKLADAMVIATQDRDHYRHAKQALNLNYHILCEKPVSPVKEECLELEELARKVDRYMVVCHVLRYAPYYDNLKNVIDSGVIGKIVNINHTENVGYWHFSHSYVRGNWRNENESAPSILAKCCHDLDLFYYFVESPCTKVYSVGTRNIFVPENAPKDAPNRCLDGCPHADECPYYVGKLYLMNKKSLTPPILYWTYTQTTGKTNLTNSQLKEEYELRSPYGRCVYKCDNDVMENQVVQCTFESGVTATLTMTANAKDCYRHTHIVGTLGEIIGSDTDNKFTVNVFGEKKSRIVKTKIPHGGHLGGDMGIAKDFYDLLEKGETPKRMSMMSQTIMSHLMAFAAEESRKSGNIVCIDV